MNTTITSAIADLQEKWHTLHNHERALAVRPIIQAHVSRRQLAAAMGVAEGTIRNLLLILEGDPVDLESFLQGDISQNELIRRNTSIQPICKNSEATPQPPEPKPVLRRIIKPPVGWKPIPFYAPLHRRP